MKQNLISIAMCTYNGERFLEQQLQSIIKQTYENLEIVIVDDSSTDNTLSIIKEYAGKDKRIKWYQNETNIGFNRNFERALKLCAGKYIAISDQDDIWEPQKIQRLADTIGDHWVAFSNSALIDSNGSPLGRNLLVDNFNYGNRDYRGILLMNFVTGHTCLITREFLQLALPIPETAVYDWWMGFVAIYNNKLIYLDEILTNYRVHPSSIIQQFVGAKNLDLIKLKVHSEHLTDFLNYSEINAADAAFARELLKGYLEKGNAAADPAPFINMLNLHYTQLFPDEKPRGEAERLAFCSDYASKVNGSIQDTRGIIKSAK
jgi:glycosyltransferase involved in cell wall biosynthesis